MMRKKIVSLCMALALCLSLLPATALAAAPNGQVIYVGNENVTNGGYWTTDSDGNVTASTAGETPTDNYISYDAENNVLTLHNATIKNELEFNASIEGGTLINDSAIGVFNESGNAELTISLVGTNTIANVDKGIYVLANSTGGATLTITGDGSLNASASQTGIWVQSNSNNAALCVENAEVTASVDGAFNDGVLVQAKDGSDVSLTVNGGSLTASVNANIWFQFGSGVSGSGTPTVTVSNNAIVRANGGIANTSSTSIQYGTGSDSTGGIVFDGNTGTVYGAVTLQENLTIGEGESLTVPEGSSLNCNGKLTNNGTILASGGTVSGQLKNGTTVTTPSITGQPQNKKVTAGETAEFSVTATAGSETPTYQWQQSTDSGSNWTDISGATSASYTINSTTISMSGYQYRCVVKSASGVSVISQAATLTVKQSVSPTSYSISAYVAPAGAGTVTVNGSGTSATVTANSEVALAATANDGYRFTGWMENDRQVSTDATYTFKATGDRTLTAKFEKKVTGVTLNTETLELFTGGSATLTATVEPSDAANQNVTWASSDPSVATVDAAGKVTAVAPGTATITATTVDGGFTAICTVTVRPDIPPANPNYRITVEATQGGTVTADPTAAKAGATVTLTPVPDRGYQVGTVAVTDRFGEPVAVTEQADGTYTFTMPNGQVTVTVTFEQAPLPFHDVTEGDWFYEAVRYAYENGLMDGVGDNLFAPNSETTRAQLVTILYRLAGEPEPGGDSGFADVAAGTWYTDAVAWAAENGIVNGVSDTEFAPGEDITREQLAAILYRYAAYQGYDVSQRADLLGFGDAESISGYAQEALSWAHAQGLVLGFEDGSLRPQGTASRAQIAAVLMRFLAAVSAE